MTKQKISEGMEFDPKTNMLYVDGMDPFEVESLSDDEQKGLEDWHKTLENGEK